MANKQAIISNIQRLSLDDGPGIRTTVFFKGCTLNCKWCHNPECINCEPEIQYNKKFCKHCDVCNTVCPNHCISNTEDGKTILRSNCVRCGTCTRACLYNALSIVGKPYSVDTLLTEILKDVVYYRESNGGITFSGGEPLMQYEFIAQVEERLKEQSIHTTIDTCGFVDWHCFERILPTTDLFLYDVKAFSPALHKELTGHENTLIKENLKKLDDSGARIWIRVPLILELNDIEAMEISAYLAQFNNIEHVDLLAYHSLGVAKHESLERVYDADAFHAPSLERLEEIAQDMRSRGLTVNVKGGR